MVVGFAKRQVKNAEARKNCRQWRQGKSEIPSTVEEQETNSTMKKTLLECNLSGTLKVHEICLGGLHFKAGDAFHQTRFSIRATLSRILRRLEEGNLPLMRKRLTGAEKKKKKRNQANCQ